MKRKRTTTNEVAQSCQRGAPWDGERHSRIDRPVRGLVTVLNRLPGVCTVSSCGGHRDPRNVSQCRRGEFYVNFLVDRTRAAWRSLGYLTWIIAKWTSGMN